MFSQRPPVYHSHEVHCGPNTDAQPQGKWQVDIIHVCLVCMWESWVCKCLCKGSMHTKLEIQLTTVLILLHACPLLALRPKTLNPGLWLDSDWSSHSTGYFQAFFLKLLFHLYPAHLSFVSPDYLLLYSLLPTLLTLLSRVLLLPTPTPFFCLMFNLFPFIPSPFPLGLGNKGSYKQ